MFNKVLSCAVVGVLFVMAPTFVFAAEWGDAAAAELLAKQINAGRQYNLSTSNKFAYGVTLSRMPASVGTPNYSGIFTQFNDTATLIFWRESIDNKERLFVKVEPTTASYFFCPGGSQFSIVQNGRDYGQAFRATRGDNGSVCQSLKISEIFLVDQWSSYTNFVEASAFVISFASTGSYYAGSINVSASSGSAAPPTPTQTVPGAIYSNGFLIIKRLEVDTGTFGKAYYDVTMTLKALSNPLTFTVDSVVPSK